MKTKGRNYSSVKTKELIKHTAIEMLHDLKDSNQFTVSELCRRADINRTTFYNHYDGIGDVIEAVQTDILDALIPTYPIRTRDDIVVFLIDQMKGIRDHEEIIRLMLASDEPMSFLLVFREKVFERLFPCEELKTLSDADRILFDLKVFFGGTAQMYLDYFRGRDDHSLREIEKGLLHAIQHILFEEEYPKKPMPR